MNFNKTVFLIVIISVVSIGLSSNFVSAEEFEVIIPFGAYNPELNTPTDVWFDPPIISIQTGDTITWYNDDREGHTITSGQGSGRFGWMSDDFGTPDGVFDSGRFNPSESWSLTFEESGPFSYFCLIHPWMEGIVLVENVIPDYPHDAFGKIIKEFPLLRYTPDQMIEANLTWEPNVIKTHEKINFIYQFYDPQTSSNLAKMGYDFVLIQNGKEIYRDSGVNQIGGDFRKYAFSEPGTVIIRLEGIQSAAGLTEETTTVGGTVYNKAQRSVEFSTVVYDNPEMISHEAFDVKPAQRLEFYYELAMLIISIPAVLFLALVFWMKKKPKYISSKSTPI